VFPKSVNLDPVSLAVWFQDDGSYDPPTTSVSISYGLDIGSDYSVVLDKLASIGINSVRISRDKRSSKFVSLNIVNESKEVLFELIRPYVQPCMAYKTPWGAVSLSGSSVCKPSKGTLTRLTQIGWSDREISVKYGVTVTTVRRWRKEFGISVISGDKRRVARGYKDINELGRVEAYELYVNQGMSVPDMAKLHGVSLSYMYNHLAKRGFIMGKYKHIRKPENVLFKLEGHKLKKGDWAKLSEIEQQEKVLEVIQLLRKAGFPHKDPPDEEAIIKGIGDVRKAGEVGERLSLNSAGGVICDKFFPHRYSAWRSDDKVSAWNAWYNDHELTRAIKLQLKSGDPITPHRVLRAVTLGHRTPTNFRPVAAKLIVERLLPSGVVWDPCIGYGGRMLGVLSSDRDYTYIGSDVMKMSVSAAGEMGKAVNKIVGVKYKVQYASAEEGVSGKVDMVFTSPPYFDVERYDDTAEQAWKRYNSVDEWVNGFLCGLINSTKRVLNPDGFLILNVANTIKAYGQKVPMADIVKEFIVSNRFRLVHEWVYPLHVANRTKRGAWEPVLVFALI